MRFRTVLLDVGETLVGPRVSFGAVYAGALAPLGIEHAPAQFEAALRRVWLDFDRTIPSGVDRYRHFPGGEREYWLRFARRTLVEVGAGEIADDTAERALDALRDAFVSPSAWQVYEDVVPALETLRRDGVRLGVVSNWDSRLVPILQRLGLARYFDTLVVSHAVGVEKPDPAIFRIALERLEARPDTAIHAGDRADLDVAGARAAGLAGVLVDRRGSGIPDVPAIPDLSPLPAIAARGLG